jgi:hypothetical protein
MPKSKRRKSVDPQVLARRREQNARKQKEDQRERLEPEGNPPPQPQREADTPLESAQLLGDEVLVSRSSLMTLTQEMASIRDTNENLRGELERLLTAYSTLVTTSFKLGVTLSEYDIAQVTTVDRVRSKMNFFIDDLPRSSEKAGVKMANLLGLEYSPSLNVEVLNLEDFPAGESLEIDEVLEPLLTYAPKFLGDQNFAAGGLLKRGVVTVKRKGNEA